MHFYKCFFLLLNEKAVMLRTSFSFILTVEKKNLCFRFSKDSEQTRMFASGLSLLLVRGLHRVKFSSTSEDRRAALES